MKSDKDKLEQIRRAWERHSEACGSDLWRSSNPEDRRRAKKAQDHTQDMLFAVLADAFAPI